MRSERFWNRLLGSGLLLSGVSVATAGCTTEAACFQDCTEQAPVSTAGTSTGGMTGKRWGRIGDSPVIGAGTYAADGICAVSATGSGEFFIRTSAARQVCDRIAWQKVAVQAAADATIADIGTIGGDGGLIALDGQGRIAFAMNSSGMYRGWVTGGGSRGTAIYSDEAGPASRRPR